MIETYPTMVGPRGANAHNPIQQICHPSGVGGRALHPQIDPSDRPRSRASGIAGGPAASPETGSIRFAHRAAFGVSALRVTIAVPQRSCAQTRALDYSPSATRTLRKFATARSPGFMIPAFAYLVGSTPRVLSRRSACMSCFTSRRRLLASSESSFFSSCRRVVTAGMSLTNCRTWRASS